MCCLVNIENPNVCLPVVQIHNIIYFYMSFIVYQVFFVCGIGLFRTSFIVYPCLS